MKNSKRKRKKDFRLQIMKVLGMKMIKIKISRMTKRKVIIREGIEEVEIMEIIDIIITMVEIIITEIIIITEEIRNIAMITSSKMEKKESNSSIRAEEISSNSSRWMLIMLMSSLNFDYFSYYYINICIYLIYTYIA